MLLAQELPAEGGDTLFADQHAAWDALPEPLKARVRHLEERHLGRARDHGVDVAAPDELGGLAHGVRAGGAGGGEQEQRAERRVKVARAHGRFVFGIGRQDPRREVF